MRGDPGTETGAMSSGVGVCRIYREGQLLRLCYSSRMGLRRGNQGD